MNIHLVFDLFAFVVAFFISHKWIRPSIQIIQNENIRYSYYITLSLGSLFGAFGLGTLNVYYSSSGILQIGIGKSVLGAIFGGIIAVEIFKKIFNIQGSTGAYFVPSLSIAIAIGRIGCYLSGIEDYTYGVETTFIFGHDFGDGILRHPVQLYESVAMGIFFLYTLWLYKKNRALFEQTIFYQFIGYYSLQRFFWELLKPYKSIAFGINIFGFVCLALIFYAAIYLRNKKGKM